MVSNTPCQVIFTMAAPNEIQEMSSVPITSSQSRTYVGIYANSDISWEQVPSHNGSPSAAILYPHKDRSRHLSGVGSQNLSVVQHVPPSHQRPFIENHSMLPEVGNFNNLVSSSTEYTREAADVPSEPVNYREDVDMDDKQLLLISTKELNRILKKKGVSKARQKEIKSERRTLKNRGKYFMVWFYNMFSCHHH